MSCFIIESLSGTVGGVRSAVRPRTYRSITSNFEANLETMNSTT
jgi:hypothetical protein